LTTTNRVDTSSPTTAEYSMHSFRYRESEWARRSSFLIAITMAVSCTPHVATSRPVAVGPEPGPYDVVITGGKLVDGSGNAWFYGDVAIKGDHIARIAPRGALDVRGARSHIDATGLVVAPGFIDIQGQSGGSFLLGDGRDVSKLTQGVTTEILGEGETPAPENDLTLAGADLSDRKVAAVVEQMRGPHGFDAWLRAMQAHGI